MKKADQELSFSSNFDIAGRKLLVICSYIFYQDLELSLRSERQDKILPNLGARHVIKIYLSLRHVIKSIQSLRILLVRTGESLGAGAALAAFFAAASLDLVTLLPGVRTIFLPGVTTTFFLDLMVFVLGVLTASATDPL